MSIKIKNFEWLDWQPMFRAPLPEYNSEADRLMAQLANECPHDETRVSETDRGWGTVVWKKHCFECGALLERHEYKGRL